MQRVVDIKKGGVNHCETGPAVIFIDGVERWFLEGVWISKTRDYCSKVGMNDMDTAVMILKYGESLIDANDSTSYETYLMEKMVVEELRYEIDTHILDQLMEMKKDVK